MSVIPCTDDELPNSGQLIRTTLYGIPPTDNLYPWEAPQKKGCAPKILFVLEQPYYEDVFPGTVLIKRCFCLEQPLFPGTVLIKRWFCLELPLFLEQP
jgi:hypothetical protein